MGRWYEKVDGSDTGEELGSKPHHSGVVEVGILDRFGKFAELSLFPDHADAFAAQLIKHAAEARDMLPEKV